MLALEDFNSRVAHLTTPWVMSVLFLEAHGTPTPGLIAGWTLLGENGCIPTH